LANCCRKKAKLAFFGGICHHATGERADARLEKAMTETWSDELLLNSLEGIVGNDAQGWQRAGGTGAGGYFYAAPGVLVAVPAPGYMQAAADAERSLAECHRIVREQGRSHAVIVLVDRVASQDGSARRVWAQAKDHDLRCGMALVCRSALARAIGSFFIGLNRPAVPTKMFRDFPDALKWAEEKVRKTWACGERAS
jgi:hypothetical protein